MDLEWVVASFKGTVKWGGGLFDRFLARSSAEEVWPHMNFIWFIPKASEMSQWESMTIYAFHCEVLEVQGSVCSHILIMSDLYAMLWELWVNIHAMERTRE